nr:hypothetical protein [Chloroflexota bacterium]
MAVLRRSRCLTPYTSEVAYPNGMDPARLYTPNQRGQRAGRWFSLSAVFGAGHGSTPLPVGAWVIKDGRPSTIDYS